MKVSTKLCPCCGSDKAPRYSFGTLHEMLNDKEQHIRELQRALEEAKASEREHCTHCGKPYNWQYLDTQP